jgi:L-ribulokinase
MTDRVVMAVDVGTGSARAGVFDASGRMLARDSRPIAMNRPAQEHAEQDCCAAKKGMVSGAPITYIRHDTPWRGPAAGQ